MIPQFMHYYGYSRKQVLNEYAKSFFALCNAMYKLIAIESLYTITNYSAAQAGDKAKPIINELEKQSEGLDGILKEVRTIQDGSKR